MKSFIKIGLICLSLSAYQASAADSCATILCLGGSMLGGKGGLMCKQPIQDYFDIVKRKHGKFSPSRTYKARWDYLQKCSSAQGSDKSRIQAKFGTVPSNPNHF